MGQTYTTPASSKTLKLSRQDLLDRDDALRSNFSGTAYPSSPAAVIGQHCYRTDLGEEYVLTATGPEVWTLCLKGSILPVTKGGTGGATQADGRTGLGLGGLAVLSSVSATELGTDAVTTSKIQALAVTSTKLAVGAVDAAALADNAVDAGALQTDAVTTAKILALNVTLAKIESAAKAFDAPFRAGYDDTMTAIDLVVQTYDEFVIARDVTIEGELATLATAATGAALIFDILKNGTTIYSVRPQFAAGSTTLTGGTLNVTTAAAGDVIRFIVFQIGSTVAGQGLKATLKTRLR